MRAALCALCFLCAGIPASAQLLNVGTAIRVSGDSSVRVNNNLLDSNTLSSVQFVRGDYVTFEVGMFDKGNFLSNTILRYTNITLGIFDSENTTNTPVMFETVTNTNTLYFGGSGFNTNLAYNNALGAGWSNGPSGSTNQDALFVFDPTQTSFSLGGQAAAGFWLRVYAVTTDSDPRIVTYIEAPITVYDGPISADYAGPAISQNGIIENVGGPVTLLEVGYSDVGTQIVTNEPTTNDSAVILGTNNVMSAPFAGGYDDLVLGGQSNSITYAGPPYVYHSGVIGGSNNFIAGTQPFFPNSPVASVILYGSNNAAVNCGPCCSILGGTGDQIAYYVQHAGLFAGISNRLIGSSSSTSDGCVIIGGSNNAAGGLNAATLGGNATTNSGICSVILGGFINVVQFPNSASVGGTTNNVRGYQCAILGGSSNNIGYYSDGSLSPTNSVILGGTSNTVLQDLSARLGNNSIAAGVGAVVSNSQAFLWNDGTAGPWRSTNDDTFTVHASNGIALVGPLILPNPGTNIYTFPTTSGFTNTGQRVIRIFGFVGTSVTFSNSVSTWHFSIGTIASPGQMLLLNPGESLFGTSCAAAGMIDF